MIKEPYVSLKEIIIDNPSVANIDESSILAGVVNAPCGPDHMLVQGPKEFLKYFTIGNAIPRDAHRTLINAYFCSFFAPILIKRAWNAEEGVVPVQSWSYADSGSIVKLDIDVESLPNISTGKQSISLKYPTDLVSSDPTCLGASQWVVGITTPTAWDGNCTEFDEESNYSTGDLVIYDGKIYLATEDHEASEWSASGWEEITTKLASDFGATPYGFLSSELEGNDLFVVYWYDAALGNSAMTDESAGWLLVSTSTTGIDPRTEKGVYFEDVLDAAEVPFNLKLAAFSDGLYAEAKFGNGGATTDYNISSSTDSSDFEIAFRWFNDNSDVYNISYVSAFGETGGTYEKTISTDCALENTRWFYFCDVPTAKSNKATDVISWVNGLSLGDTYRTAIVGGNDKNPSVTGWPSEIMTSSLILQKLYSNKASNSEFAPLFDATNGTLSAVKPYKQFTKSDREKLLNNTYPINWIKYDRTNNVYYMNDNRTHTRKINVMNEEMNVRMVNKIQRDVMLLVQRYKGMLNTVDTRLDVVGLIDDYMNRYIMSQNYRPVEYRIICDETNNTSDIINANKLAIELDVRLQGSIKFINILNKVFPLGVEFEQ